MQESKCNNLWQSTWLSSLIVLHNVFLELISLYLVNTSKPSVILKEDLLQLDMKIQKYNANLQDLLDIPPIPKKVVVL